MTHTPLRTAGLCGGMGGMGWGGVNYVGYGGVGRGEVVWGVAGRC